MNRLVLGTWQGDTFGDDYAYHHDNTNKTEQTAIYSQGEYRFNDEWALTIGLRWAEDEKAVSENRGGLYEANDVWWGLFDAPFFQVATRHWWFNSGSSFARPSSNRHP